MSLREAGLKEYSSRVDTAFGSVLWRGGGSVCIGEWSSGGQRHSRNKTRTIQEQRGNAHFFPSHWKWSVWGSQCVLLLQEPSPLPSEGNGSSLFPSPVKSSSPQPHSSSNVSSILQNPYTAPARPRCSVSKPNHGFLFTTVPKTIGKKLKLLKIINTLLYFQILLFLGIKM